MLRTWLHTPSQTRLIAKAFTSVKPVLKQLSKSGYVFTFHLPISMVSLLGSSGDYAMFRFLNAVTVTPKPTAPLPGAHGAELLASSVGPSELECEPAIVEDASTLSFVEMKYSESVRQRSKDGGFVEKIGLYRDGCFGQPWEKSLENLWDLQQIRKGSQPRRRSSSSGGIFDTGPEGMIKAPTTVIWGNDDVAIENSIGIEGFGDYFGARGSHLILINKCGHWSPIEKQGVPIFMEVIDWALQGEFCPLQQRLRNDFPLAIIAIER